MHRRTLLKALLATALPFPAAPADSEARCGLSRPSEICWSARPSGPACWLQDPAYAAIFAEQFSILVPENAMKWDSIHPEQDRYDFRDADQIADFAAKNSLRLRGHNLCWHEAQPPWLAAVANPDNAAALLESHIATVAGRYAGRIHSWDVVNEAVEPGDHRPDGLRDTNWLRLLGKDYIAIAFRAAAQADPKALLTYNDYGLEQDDTRREATLGLLRWMRQNRIPIHALGLQSHLSASYNEAPDWSGLDDFLKRVAKLDLQVFVTELEIDDNGLDGKLEDRAKESAWLVKDYLKNVLKHPIVKAVLTWGLASGGTYGGQGYAARHHALPYDSNLKPAPFLAAMRDALRKG